MPKRIAAALLLMILQKVVSRRKRLREDARPRQVQEKEEAEKGKTERALNLQSQMPVRRKRVPEAQVPRISQSREAAKITKPAEPANGEKSANFGIPTVQILCQGNLQGWKLVSVSSPEQHRSSEQSRQALGRTSSRTASSRPPTRFESCGGRPLRSDCEGRSEQKNRVSRRSSRSRCYARKSMET